MKKHIAEELPARKFAPAAAGKEASGGDEKKEKGGKTPEERIRQAVYDIRYRARREKLTLSQAFSQYMQNSNMSQVEKTAVRKKLAGKDGTMKEDYQIEELASNSIASAFHKVFVEGVKTNEIDEEYIEELKANFNKHSADRKYKVRVTGTDGRSYVRYATREKINQLRANPNIKEVEMTQYGEPYEGEKKRGEQTARAKAGKSLDPVGKEDGDIDNDGDKDKSDEYLANRRKVRGAAISGRGKVAEEFLGEIKTAKKSKDIKYDVMNGKNEIVVMPSDTKSIGEKTELTEKKLTKAEKAKKEEIVKSLKSKYGKTSKTYAIATSVAKRVAEEAGPEEDEEPKLKKSEGGCEDPREIPTKINLVKNKLRAMGLKMSYEPEGEQIDEFLGGIPGDGYIGHPNLDIKNPLAKTQKKEKVLPKAAPGSGGIFNRVGATLGDRNPQLNSYEPEGEQLDEMLPALALGAGLLAAPAIIKAVADKPVKKALDAASKNPNRPLLTGGTVGQLNQAKAGMREDLKSEGEVLEARYYGRRGPDRNSLGGADRDGGRNRYLGSATPEQEAEEKKRARESAEAAVAQLRRRRAAEEARKNKG